MVKEKREWFNTVFAPIITFIVIGIIGLGGSVWSAQAIIKERQDGVIVKILKYETEIGEINRNINTIKMDVQELKIMLKSHMKTEVANGEKRIASNSN